MKHTNPIYQDASAEDITRGIGLLSHALRMPILYLKATHVEQAKTFLESGLGNTQHHFTLHAWFQKFGASELSFYLSNNSEK